MNPRHLAVPALLAALAAVPARGDVASVADLGVDAVAQDWGKPMLDRSVDGHGLSVAGHAYDHGLGTHAELGRGRSTLHGAAQRLTAHVGVDDEVKDHPDVERAHGHVRRHRRPQAAVQVQARSSRRPRRRSTST